MDKWPQQYTMGQVETFLRDALPSILRRLDALEQSAPVPADDGLRDELARIAGEIERLEQGKQDRKGRKPLGANGAGGNLDG